MNTAASKFYKYLSEEHHLNHLFWVQSWKCLHNLCCILFTEHHALKIWRPRPRSRVPGQLAARHQGARHREVLRQIREGLQHLHQERKIRILRKCPELRSARFLARRLLPYFLLNIARTLLFVGPMRCCRVKNVLLNPLPPRPSQPSPSLHISRLRRLPTPRNSRIQS